MKFKTRIDLIELLERWHKEKKSKVETYSNWVDSKELTLWHNPHLGIWDTDEKKAFKGFVSRKISADIDKLWES